MIRARFLKTTKLPVDIILYKRAALGLTVLGMADVDRRLRIIIELIPGVNYRYAIVDYVDVRLTAAKCHRE